MKKFKRIASAVAALALAATLAVPMAATMSMTASAATVTVGTDATRTYKAYQIFAGTLPDAASDTSMALQVTGWGSNVNSEASGFLTALQGIKVGTDTFPFASITSADDAAGVAAILAAESEDDTAVLKAFAAFIADYTTGDPISSTENKLTINTIGYYLVEETTSGSLTNGAKTRYLLQVINTADEQTIDTKTIYPTVDKQVSDEEADATPLPSTPETGNPTNLNSGADGATNGKWYESADHEIGETFQFKLTAQLPNDDEIDEYKFYKLEFEDSWSTGVTFDGNVIVTIGETPYTITGNTEGGTDSTHGISYTVTGNKLTVTIANLKAESLNIEALKNLTVTVVYDAHLNTSADVETTSGATENENKVKLNYSNNPNVKGNGDNDSTGTTPEDSVWVFTYEVDNKKTDLSGTVLANAQFELYRGESATGSPIVFLKGSDNKYYVTKYASVDAAKSAEPTNADNFVTTITTPASGLFNFVGLDTGKYTLHEAKAPNGYKAGDDIVVTVTGTHQEYKPAETGAKNNVDLTIKYKQGTTGEDETLSGTLQVKNSPASALPGTGGIGTTLFYLVGGTLVVGAGVTLITKKRMQKD